MSKKASKTIIFITTGAALVLAYFLLAELFPKNSEFDVPTKSNPKIIAMFDKQLQVQIDDHEQNDFHPGYLPTAKEHVAEYLKTITKIESYSRYGVTSSRARNAIEVRIYFEDGSMVEDVYTGNTSSHVMPPPLLMSVAMRDGKTISVLTNGIEKTGSPEWILNDLNTLIDAVIGYDKNRNSNGYFPPEKTTQDFEKEWE